ncbi:nickel/cobalt ABC transporter permease [Sulfurospirillum arcachonense]|uniref:nickel/cobalt ABC transporter permease n=1 Tax=Sulfurospirillum arcachonense TaxID=57666 RepID=UPI0004697240|nr:nickel/cobalt ABC transporter permease [Sulfurospirillum arcachonense]
MLLYTLKRLALIVPLLWGISLVTFTLINLSPSDPAEVSLRINEITPTPEAIAQMREELGLDKPLVQRYTFWLSNLIHGDFGTSYVTKEPVAQEILYALPTTLALASLSLVLIVVFGLSLGIVCAIYENTFIDKAIRGFVFFFTAMPNFWMGLLLIWFFAFHLGLFPTSGLENPSGIILPAITLALSYVSTYIRLMRNTMIESKQELYVLYARARGLKERVITKHIVKNALHPFIVALGMSIPKLLAGTVIVENIFALPGVGRICVNAIFSRDFPMIQTYILFMALMFMIFNLMVDVITRVSDPRLRRQI